MARKEKKAKKRGSKLKWIIIALVLLMLIGAASQSKKDGKTESSQKATESTETSQKATEKETEKKTEKVQEVTEKITEKVAETTEKVTEKVTEPVTEATKTAFTLEIEAGEAGEYGQELVLGEDTEFPDYTIGYFVPAGTYKVTNIGDYPTQVNVYKNEKHVTEEGWEEWADGKSERLEVDASVEMTVSEGYFINVDEPSYISIEKID